MTDNSRGNITILPVGSDLPGEDKSIVVWCKLNDLDSVLSALGEYDFIRDEVPVKNPADNEAVGEYVGISGKMSDVYLIYLQQNPEVSAVEIIK